jgi:hypothetical protein
MDKMDKIKEKQIETVKILEPYLMALPQSKINTGSLIVYAKALMPLSLAEIDAAMLKLMQNMKWFPTIAEIFEEAKDIRKFIGKQEIPEADDAWHEAMKLAHDKWLYGKWEYSCAEVKKAIENFGKRELCTIEAKDLNTARAQFTKMYNNIIQRSKNNAANKEVVKSLPTGRINELIGSTSKKMIMPKE